MPRGLPPVLISPTTWSRAVSISEIVPPFSLPTRARPASAKVAIGSLPAQHPEAEAVQVHGMGHRDRAVLDFPDFARTARHAERDLVGPVRGLVDEKAGAFVEVEPHPPRRRLGLRGGFQES